MATDKVAQVTFALAASEWAIVGLAKHERASRQVSALMTTIADSIVHSRSTM